MCESVRPLWGSEREGPCAWVRPTSSLDWALPRPSAGIQPPAQALGPWGLRSRILLGLQTTVSVVVVLFVPLSRQPPSRLPDMRKHHLRTKSRRCTYLVKEERSRQLLFCLFHPLTLFVLFVTEELFQTDAEKVNNGSGFVSGDPGPLDLEGLSALCVPEVSPALNCDN